VGAFASARQSWWLAAKRLIDGPRTVTRETEPSFTNVLHDTEEGPLTAEIRIWGAGMQLATRQEETHSVQSSVIHPRTKRIARAGLFGLLASVIITAINIMATGLEPWELDQDAITASPGIIAHWLGRLGLIPFIFIIVSSVRSFRTHGMGASVLDGIVAVGGICFIICIGVSIQSDTDLLYNAGSARTWFVEKTAVACFRTQRARVENRETSDALITEFCGCYANALADVTTAGDVKYFKKYNEPSQTTAARMSSSYERCRASL
jgi:hypothetical protein